MILKKFIKFINYNLYKQLYDEKEKNGATIKIFESFSKKFESIIELEKKNEKDIFDDVYQIIQGESLICKLDSEDFLKINIKKYQQKRRNYQSKS